jgi:hypothetical protein
MKDSLVIFWSLIIAFLVPAIKTDAQELNLTREVIDGPANIRNDDGRIVLFSLNDSGLVESVEKDGKYIVGLAVLLDFNQLKSKRITKGDTLFGLDRKRAGFAKADIPVSLIGYWGKNTGFIKGYSAKQNIRPESVIELVLTDLILNRNFTVSIEDLNPIIINFKLIKEPEKDWYFCHEGTLVDLSPQDRITLMIEDNKLIGIVHSRSFTLKNRQTYPLIRGHSFTPVIEMSQARINNILRERIAFYNSAD